MPYMNAGINSSQTIIGISNAAISSPAMLGFAANANGKLVIPTAGAPVLGFALPSEDAVEANGQITLQVKDIGYAIAGAVIKLGDELMIDATGKVIPATATKAIVGVAYAAAAANGVVSIMITRGGYKPA
ncbi:MAG: DUF2190 family protein [Clostridia bacterium]